MANRSVGGISSVLINGVPVGNSVGKADISVRKQQTPIYKPDSIHPFKFLQTGIVIQIRFSIAKHFLDNLAMAFGVASLASPITGASILSASVPSYTLQLQVEGITYSFTSVVENGASLIRYNVSDTTIPLVFNVVLGSAGTVATLGGQNLPAQFDYGSPDYPWRGSEMKTFGGNRRSASSTLLDGEIRFTCENMTSAEKTTLETLHTSNSRITELAFTGIHSDSATVLFWDLSSFREKNGLWSASGVLKIK